MEQERVNVRRQHSAQLKALVLEQCAEPGTSVAKVVAMSHGLNANMVHGWRKCQRDATGLASAPKSTGSAQFVAVSLPVSLPVSLTPSPAATAPAPADIQIELRRGITAVKLTWPIAAAADCAAWMRELLR